MNLQLVEIDASKKARVQEGTTGMLAAIRGFEVVDVASMENLAIMVGVLKDKKAEIVAFYKPYLEQAQEVKRSAEKNRKMVDTDQAAAIAPYDECIALANRMTQTFRAQEQERRDREARAEQDRLRKIEEDKRLAIALEIGGVNPEEAARILDEPVVTPIVKAEQVAKPLGYKEVTRWKAEVVDFGALPDEYKLADTVKLNQKATNDKERAIVPGVRFYADTKSY